MIYYITSFNKELYEATGRKLIISFLRNNKNYKFYVGHEEFIPKEHHESLILDEISKDKILRKFLKDNKDIIPDYLGGKAVHCNCRSWDIRHSPHHVKGCHYHWMNRNAYRFFKKVVTINRAITRFPEQKMIWLDSDCKIMKMIGETTFTNLLAGKSIFYFQGWKREAPDVGIIGFDFSNGDCRNIFQKWLLKFTSGEFRNDKRWDDGYQFGLVKKEHWCHDLGKLKRLMWLHSQHIIPRTVIRKYIRHDKGTHGRLLDIMK